MNCFVLNVEFMVRSASPVQCSNMYNVPPKFYQLCRLCLSDDKENALFIFDKTAMERNIAKKIMTCLSILVSDDDYLPHTICSNCSEQIESLYMFVEIARKTENVLHQYLNYTKELKGNEEEKLQQSMKLLENLTTSMPLPPEKMKQEPPEVPTSHIPIIKSETDVPTATEESQKSSTVTGEIAKDEPPPEEPQVGPLREPPSSEPSRELLNKFFQDSSLQPFAMDVSQEQSNTQGDHLIKVKPPNELRYPPDLLPADTHPQSIPAYLEPTDLSNKRTENVTCVPEIDYMKDDADTVSLSSNSSDPERLEVDMSQMPEEFSNSTTPGEVSPTPEATHHFPHPMESDPALWQALSRNGYKPSLMGDAGQLLRKLMSCRKLGMTITPTPHVLNYTLFKEQQSPTDPSNSEKSSARRKQSFPSKANVQAGAAPAAMEHDHEEEDSREGSSPDFTGNSPWCNLVKGKGGASMGKRVDLRCTNCGTQTTTIWRRNLRGEMVCNACGLYFKLHGIDRPVTMRRDTIHTRRRRPKALEKEKIPGQKNRTDTDDMLSALRRQIQPHLVRALQGHRHLNMPVNPHVQVPPVPNFLPSEVSIGCSAREAESDEDSIADLPLNLVSTQMAEGELL